MSVSVAAGATATVLFAVSTLPMLVKARRTRDVSSYSLGNIALGNVGNAFYTVYVLHLPFGPIWALHAFHTVSTFLMLFWYVRYARARRRAPELDSAELSAPMAHRPIGEAAAGRMRCAASRRYGALRLIRASSGHRGRGKCSPSKSMLARQRQFTARRR